jgi:hypothetical protein
MVNYNVIEHVTDRCNNVGDANEKVKEYLETVDNTKVIRFVKITRVGVLYEGSVIHDA